jgi:hypothetical protein
MPGQYLDIGHGHFLPYPYLLAVYDYLPIPFDAVQIASLYNLRSKSRSWGSSVNVATRLWAGRSGFDSRQNREGILFFAA